MAWRWPRHHLSYVGPTETGQREPTHLFHSGDSEVSHVPWRIDEGYFDVLLETPAADPAQVVLVRA